VVGVDTHRDQHVLSVVLAPAGAVVAQRSVAASGRGYAQALRFADSTQAVFAFGRLKERVITAPGLLAI
jgi:hypothetical protein